MRESNGAAASASWRAGRVQEKHREGFAAYVEGMKDGLSAVVGVEAAQREAARPARRAVRMGRSSMFES